MKDHAWNELLDEFRALGGIVDNVCLKDGVFGRGLFTVDATKPVVIHVPDNLLVKSRDIVFLNGKALVGSAANVGARERRWLDAYQDTVSWGGGGRTEIERLFAMAQDLPEDIQNRLFHRFHCGPWFSRPTEEAIQRHFLETRRIAYKGDDVLAPIVECANHGEDAIYDATNGISLKGQFSGEVLIKYSNMDSFGFFKNWGFAAARPPAFSIVLKGHIQSKPFRIGRQRFSKTSELMTEGDSPMLSHMLLGDERYPRLAKVTFFQIMQNA
ncbi:MAG TPA: hypothetical protein VMF58_15805, partial [Rhizomicrobium sp.]|nr:hypothetical protein [Rhizomicrobium sp.]